MPNAVGYTHCTEGICNILGFVNQIVDTGLVDELCGNVRVSRLVSMTKHWSSSRVRIFAFTKNAAKAVRDVTQGILR